MTAHRHVLLHLSDDEIQSLAEGIQGGSKHLEDCPDCQATAAGYRELGHLVGALERPQPPRDFTTSLMARLPPAPPAVSGDDLAAVVVAVGAAVVASLLFVLGGGTSALLAFLHAIPGKALAEAMVAASLGARDQISVLLFLSAAALLIGTALWRVFSQPRVAA